MSRSILWTVKRSLAPEVSKTMSTSSEAPIATTWVEASTAPMVPPVSTKATASGTTDAPAVLRVTATPVLRSEKDRRRAQTDRTAHEQDQSRRKIPKDPKHY